MLLQRSTFETLVSMRGANLRFSITAETAVHVEVDEKSLAWRHPENFIHPATVSVPRTTVAISYDKWPRWAKVLSRFRTADDVGVGDTVRRRIGTERSKRFKKAFKKITGRSCGCDGRQALWNVLYKYERPAVTSVFIRQIT